MSKRVRAWAGVTARGWKGRTMTLRIARKILTANRRWSRESYGVFSTVAVYYSREWIRAHSRLKRHSEKHPNWLAMQCVRGQISELEYVVLCLKRDKNRKQKKPRNNGKRRRSWK